MIVSGEKTEEYREIKRYWIQRLCNEVEYENNYGDWEAVFKKFDCVSANNGYGKDCPNLKWEHKGIRIGEGNTKWGAEAGKEYFVLSIGKILSQT